MELLLVCGLIVGLGYLTRFSLYLNPEKLAKLLEDEDDNDRQNL
jgi:hypothetical protein